MKNNDATTGGVDVLIDTDIAIGVPQRDVDDGLALVMALNAPTLNISAITLTYGNDSLDNVVKSLSDISSRINKTLPSYAGGAASSKDLGKKTPASDLICAQLESGPKHILALGPLTNIASVVTLRPDLVHNIAEIVMVAGRRPGFRFRTGNASVSHPDLNFELDPHAVKVLLKSNIPLVFAPYEVSSKVWITEHILELIAGNNTPMSNFLAERSKPWLYFWHKDFSTPLFETVGFNPFDCLAVAWLTDRDLLKWQMATMHIENDNYDISNRDVKLERSSEPLTMSQESVVPQVPPIMKPYLHAYTNGKDKAGQSYYIFDVEREIFLERLISRLR